jgi:hypothetical protein
VTLTTGAGGEALVLDPQNESAANAPLWLHSGGLRSGGSALSVDGGHSYAPSEPDVIWVSSPETEGELRANTRPTRRTINLTLIIAEPGDAAATNKATNPAAASATTNWTNNSLTLMERLTTFPARLDGFDTAIHATGNADDDAAYLTASVTNTVAETFSAWVYVVSGTVRLEVWNASPALNVAGSNIAAGSWQRISLAYTPTTTASYTFRVAQNGAGTSEFYVTGVQIGPADPYFSGYTPGCYWTGTPGLSSSVRRAPGGARYTGIRSDIEDKIAKLDRHGGTLRRTVPSGDRITYDVIQARIVQWQEDVLAELRSIIRGELEFVCKPYGRGDEVTV